MTTSPQPLISSPRNMTYLRGPFYQNTSTVWDPNFDMDDFFAQPISAAIMAFVHIKPMTAGGTPEIVINNVPLSDSKMVDALNALKAANTTASGGQKFPILLSIGGAGNPQDWTNIQSKPTAWATAIYQKLIVPFGFAGIDIDNEDWPGDTSDAGTQGKAIGQFLETLAAYRLTSASKLIVSVAPYAPQFDDSTPDYAGYSAICSYLRTINPLYPIRPMVNVQSYGGFDNSLTSALSGTNSTVQTWLGLTDYSDVTASVAAARYTNAVYGFCNNSSSSVCPSTSSPDDSTIADEITKARQTYASQGPDSITITTNVSSGLWAYPQIDSSVTPPATQSPYAAWVQTLNQDLGISSGS